MGGRGEGGEGRNQVLSVYGYNVEGMPVSLSSEGKETSRSTGGWRVVVLVAFFFEMTCQLFS